MGTNFGTNASGQDHIAMKTVVDLSWRPASQKANLFAEKVAFCAGFLLKASVNRE